MERFIIDLSILMVGAAIFSYLAVLLKQPIIIGYIVCGIVLGPMGFGWIKQAEFIESISHIGITLLLFLAGLCLHPQKLIQSFRETAVFLLFKPWMFKKFFLLMGEQPSFAKEIGMRLGQLSEFSLLVALLAFSLGNITHKASQLIQLTAILTFVVSSYIVVLKYPTPIGTTEKLRKD